MTGKAEKMDRPNPGIKCVVNTCHYYTNGDHCTASMIEVKPQDASDSEDTDCTTFTPKQM